MLFSDILLENDRKKIKKLIVFVSQKSKTYIFFNDMQHMRVKFGSMIVVSALSGSNERRLPFGPDGRGEEEMSVPPLRLRLGPGCEG